MHRLPAELGLGGRRVNRIAKVVPWAVGNEFNEISRLAKNTQQALNHLQVRTLVVCTEQIGAANHTAVEHRPNAVIVVININPVANIGTVAIELRAAAGGEQTNHPGN